MSGESLPSVLSFDSLELTEIPVTIGEARYVLREADTDTVAKYKSAMIRCSKLNKEGNPEAMDGVGELEPLLVSLCLFQENSHGVPYPNPVGRAFVGKLKGAITKKLFDTILEITPQLGNLRDKEQPSGEMGEAKKA